MPRRMAMDSRERIVQLVRANSKAVGPKLGYVSMKYNIPARAFAELLNTSEPTIYRWFYGECEPRQVYMTNIRRIMQVFKAAHEGGDLPLEGTHPQRMKAVYDLVIKYKPRATA